MNLDYFKSIYYYREDEGGKKEKSKDPFDNSISLLPFISNPAVSDFDSSCSLKGVTGEFLRTISNQEINPISDYKADMEEKVIDYLW
jgi:hypothetical protein